MQGVTQFIRGARVLLVLLALGQSAHAQPCRLALVLALDVSGSVNSAEYAQQVNGLAAALNDRDVRALVIGGTGAAVSLAVFEWSSRNHQYVIQPWITLDSHVALDSAILRIRSHRKIRAGLKTALGTALSVGATMLQDKTNCWQSTIDVSGDGKNNIGPSPADAYRLPEFERITVNALVIGDPSDAPRANSKQALLDYYEREVIHGPGSFAMMANGYEDYTNAMRRKLMKELALPVLGWADF